MGGEWFDQLGDDPGNISTDDIIKIALDSMRDHLGVVDEPSNTVAHIHQVWLTSAVSLVYITHALVLQQNCIAQYRLGHSKKLGKWCGWIYTHSNLNVCVSRVRCD